MDRPKVIGTGSCLMSEGKVDEGGPLIEGRGKKRQKISGMERISPLINAIYPKVTEIRRESESRRDNASLRKQKTNRKGEGLPGSKG